jgi:hypothetical protein
MLIFRFGVAPPEDALSQKSSMAQKSSLAQVDRASGPLTLVNRLRLSVALQEELERGTYTV